MFRQDGRAGTDGEGLDTVGGSSWRRSLSACGGALGREDAAGDVDSAVFKNTSSAGPEPETMGSPVETRSAGLWRRSSPREVAKAVRAEEHTGSNTLE